MDITNALEQVSSKLGDEKLPEVETVLTEIKTEFGRLGKEVSELQGALKSANHESMTRRIELNKVNQALSEKDMKIEELLNDSGSKELKKEIEGLREFKDGVIAKNRQGFVDGFSKVVEHPNFEKAKDEFVLPTPNDKGEYNFKDVSDEDMDLNVTAFNRLNRIEFFVNQPDQKKVHGINHDGKPEDWESTVRKAKSLKELRELQSQGLPS